MARLAGEEFGVLLGKGKEHDHLEIGVAFVEREKAPRLGEFIVVEEREFMKRKFLCRVEQMDYGDFQTTKGERERALVEKYLRDRSGYGRELSEEEKRGLFFRYYALKVLGEIREGQVVTEYRLLPELSAVCRYPSRDELELVLSSGLQDSVNAVKIGKLAVGNEVHEDLNVAFEPLKFERKRTAVFARTGYGKSNLCKVIVSLAALKSSAGILVLDMDGEYAFKTPAPDGMEVPGLADIDLLKPKLVVYSERRDILEQYPDVQIRAILNLKALAKQPWHLVRLFEDQDLAVVKDVAYLEADRQKKLEDMIDKVRSLPASAYAERREAVRDFVNLFPANQQNALRRQLEGVLALDNAEAADLMNDIPRDLGRGKLVVLDLSLIPMDHAILIAGLILSEVFRRNVRGITSGKMLNAVAVFEEAQNVLNKEAVTQGKTIFVRWAKEGRKYNLGLIYVSQQPGAIAEEIVSQTDNYFVMHLLNKGDIDSLEKANRHYGGVVGQFLSDETIIGNTYVYSAPYQPYIYPAKVFEFKTEFFAREFAGVDTQKFVEVLKPVVARDSGRAWQKVVGEAGYRLFEYLTSKGLHLSIMDEHKRWVDYSYMDNLIRGLHRAGALHCPQLVAEDDAATAGGASHVAGPTSEDNENSLAHEEF